MAKNYSLVWALGLVSSVHETYPRATDFLRDLLQMTDIGIARDFLNDCINWYRYKKLLRHLEELLNACIDPVPEKVWEAWLEITEPVDTKFSSDTLREPSFKADDRAPRRA